MRLVKDLLKRTVMIIILISLLITFLATPASYAKLELEEDEFYYAGTTEGSYAPSFNIFAWLLNNIGDIADWLLDIITMGFRMVFVGWTALLEKILTWALESTTGVAADGSLVGSSTDMTGLTDSSNNITVEAIVYNKVAGLNIDFFDLEFDETLSGTGKKLICDKCNKAVNECITDDKIQPVVDAGQAYIDAEKEYNEVGKSLLPGDIAGRQAAKDKLEQAAIAKKDAIDDVLKNSNCGCNSCDDCTKYLNQLASKEPMIIRLRILVATWYSIIRFLAMAAMLVVLIAIGIKMALSTIASDKAVYKRMLVDWVVGVIILFAIHYFMIFCIHMNGVVVKTIEESAQSINKVQMQQLSNSDTEISNAELEIKVYEEVRTRAYDARLINGLTGMVMYMTLVFFAFKYTIIYLKRYLTILVLTLMGPGVGVAYALQKALSGKSSALKTWMTEYIMNVIIQIVHALMYAIFISQAMVLSLQSVAGMIIALILMNYTTKADALFKKIFRFGGGDSLVGHTGNAMESAIQTAKSVHEVGTGAKMLANTPYAKAVKGVGKAALAGAVGVGAGVGAGIGAGINAINRARGGDADERYGAAMADALGGEVDQKQGESDEAYKARLQAAREKVGKDGKFKKQIALDMGKEALSEQLAKARKDLEDNTDPSQTKDKEAALKAASKRMRKYDKKTAPSTGKIALGHAKRIFEVRNEFNIKKGAGLGNNLMAIHDGVFGSLHFDRNTWKFTREKNAVFNQFSAENLFGMNEKDRKMFKEHVISPMLQGFAGMGSLFVGMATVVANPKMGMGLLAIGVTNTGRTFKKPTNINSYKGSYTFSRFGLSTMNSIKNSAIAKARSERRGLIAARLKNTNPTFTERLKNGDLKAISLGAVTAAIVPGALPAYLALHPITTAKVTGKTLATGAKATFGAVAHPVKTFHKAKASAGRTWKRTVNYVKHPVEPTVTAVKGVAKGAGNIAKSGAFAVANVAVSAAKAPKGIVDGFIANTGFAEHEEAMNRYNALEQEKRIKEFRKETDELISIQAAAEVLALNKEAEDKMMEELCRDAGFHYDKKTGTITSLSQNSDNKENAKKKDADIEQTEIVDRINNTKVTESDVNMIDREIELIIQQLSSGREIDVNSEKVQAEITRLLDNRLISSGLLENGQTVSDIFKHGERGLKQAIKKKAKKSNASVKEANKKLESFLSKEEISQVSSIVSEEIKKQKGQSTVSVSVDDVLSKLNPTRSQDGSSRVNESDGTRNVKGNKDGSRKVAEVTDEQRKSAITQFIQAVTPSTTPEPKSTASDRDAIKEITREASQRKKKLQQVMAMAMDVQLDSEPVTAKAKGIESTDSVIVQVLQGSKEITDGQKTVSLSESDADSASKMLRKLLEIKEANQEAVQVLDIKKGTKGYAKAKKKKSELSVELHKLGFEASELEAGRTVTREDGTIITPDKKDVVRRDIKKTSEKLGQAKLDENMAGPIYDITDLIKNQMGRR